MDRLVYVYICNKRRTYVIERLLISGGSDGVVRVWGNVGRAGQALRGLKAEFDHDGNITTIAYRSVI